MKVWHGTGRTVRSVTQQFIRTRRWCCTGSGALLNGRSTVQKMKQKTIKELTSEDLSDFMREHRVVCVESTDDPDERSKVEDGRDLEDDKNDHIGLIEEQKNRRRDVSSCEKIKCILFLISRKRPVLAIVSIDDRVDEQALCRFLNVPKRRVKMAPMESLISICGYPAGRVPPFGHRRRLETVVDEKLVLCKNIKFGENLEHLIPTAELLRVSKGSVALISKMGLTDGIISEESVSKKHYELQDSMNHLSMPVPWPPGAQAAVVEGMIAQKRQMAQLLTFLSLVPVSAERRVYRPAVESLVRRRWSNPDTISDDPDNDQPCEVQAICGKTIEKNLGRSEAARLFKLLRVGQIIRVVGRPQDHLFSRENKVVRSSVLDIVVHSIEILDDLSMEEEEKHLAEMGEADSRLNKLDRSHSNTKTHDHKEDESVLIYEPRQESEDILIVDSLDNLERMANVLLNQKTVGTVTPRYGRPELIDMFNTILPKKFINKSMSQFPYPKRGIPKKHAIEAAKSALENPVPVRQVVGIDCEWEPCSRAEPTTPVSILQIATVDYIFLVDMLALCRKNLVDGNSSSRMESNLHAIDLTREEIALSNILEALFRDPEVLKVGFGIKYDLKRLVESYPWLPCFQRDKFNKMSNDESLDIKRNNRSDIMVPFKSHIDLLSMARIASDGLVPTKRLGLSTLARLSMGVAIDKAEQRSHWGRRPLTTSQLKYAAADAAALIDIFGSILVARSEVLSPYWMSQLSNNLTHLPAVYQKANRLQKNALSSVAPTRIGKYTRSCQEGEPRNKNYERNQINRLPCDISSLMKELGQPIAGGKVGVVRKAAILQSFNSEQKRPNVRKTPVPHFPRGSGLLEFSNAFCLFVNVPSRSYPNTFSILADGKEDERDCLMSWWPGRGQTLDHPVIQRLLGKYPFQQDAGEIKEFNSRFKKSEERENIGDETSEMLNNRQYSILLFIRPSKRDYVFCGNLSVNQIRDIDGQLSIIWKLEEYSNLRNSFHFQEILQLSNIGTAENSIEFVKEQEETSENGIEDLRDDLGVGVVHG